LASRPLAQRLLVSAGRPLTLLVLRKDGGGADEARAEALAAARSLRAAAAEFEAWSESASERLSAAEHRLARALKAAAGLKGQREAARTERAHLRHTLLRYIEMGDSANGPLFNVLVTMLQLPRAEVKRLAAIREGRLAAVKGFSLGGLLE
jgi:hypothetical protein